MARIVSSTPEKIVTIKKFKGLNENQGGDTKLALGEASTCDNWRVTRDGNLQRRPGKVLIETLDANKAVKCLWDGWVGGYERMLAACNGKIYLVYNGATGTFPCTVLGSYTGTGRIHIFGFNNVAFIMDGVGYYSWDGTTFASVAGYIPLVANAISPIGTSDEAGALLEQVNKLTAKRRVWISPDGTAASFQLPEHPITSVDSVVNLADGTTLATTAYSVNATNGTITFSPVLPVGTNSYEITYTATADDKAKVIGMRGSEIFTKAADSRLFLYGDGTNQVLYSDIDYSGTPRADYFPDLNVINVGERNIPVTGLIRHFSRLVCFKLDSTWSISESTLTLADSSQVPAYYVSAVNRSIGNVAFGQVELVLNSPRALFNDELYEWRSNNQYSGNLTSDERQARRISDRIYNSLRSYALDACICFDDNANQEYYICYDGKALVHNYAVDAWYSYSNINATAFASHNSELYFGTDDGRICKISDTAKSDYDPTAAGNLVPIEAKWESGAMDFGAEYMRKYSSNLWVSVKPETNSYVDVSIVTDRRADFSPRTIALGSSGFTTWDFRSFSFSDNTQPQVKKIKMKAKKFGYYRLVFYSNNIETTATVLGADIMMRQTGYVK